MTRGSPLIIDTTLRDGEQMPGVCFSPPQKLELTREFIDFGVAIVELFPAVSESEAGVFRQLCKEGLGKRLRAFCRMKLKDIEVAVGCDATRILLVTSFSDIHLEHKLRISREENLRRALEMADFAASHGLLVDFAGEDASRADFAYIAELAAALKGKVELFMPADTLGRYTPEAIAGVVSRLKRMGMKIELHEHDDFGLATANTLAGIAAGADAYSSTFCGLGERTGNAAVEEVLSGLRFLHDVEVGVKMEKLKPLCDLVSKYAGITPHTLKPIIGESAFTHASGIHVDAVLKDTRNYENFSPELIGQKRRFLFGKQSGKGALRRLLGRNGNSLSEEEAVDFTLTVKAESERRNDTLTEDEVMRLFATFKPKGGPSDAPSA